MRIKKPLPFFAIIIWCLILTFSAAAQTSLIPLTSTDSVFTPPKGGGAMKFSFSWPEPSAKFENLLFSFRVQTFENTYAIDSAKIRLEYGTNKLRYICNGFTWAGGQEKVPGELTAEFELAADRAVEWTVTAKFNIPVKSITTVVRGIPKGQLSLAGERFFDPGNNEYTFEYPQLLGDLSTPLIIIKKADGNFVGLSSRQSEVRPARFFFQPGPGGYRTEMIYEQAGWDRRNQVQTCRWRIESSKSYDTIAKKHFDAIVNTYKVPLYQERKDVPAWMRQVKLVVSLHGAHWTGYIFNDYAKQLKILNWIATQIDPKQVLVFLPGWDGRYYWNYPLYQPDPRMGGEEGLKKLVTEGHKLGFHFSAMFGINGANRNLEVYKKFADAATVREDGDNFDLNWVDWDNDRRGDGWMPVMNIAVSSWRNYLRDRIAATVKTFNFDSYFLDIAGLWENNNKADMYEGTKTLIADLSKKIPGVMPIAEMHYDALMSIFPVSQVPRYSQYPEANYKYMNSYNHLSTPAPGRGSTGVHEYGFGTYHPVTKDQLSIPTISFADDTFDKYRDLVTKDIETAKLRK